MKRTRNLLIAAMLLLIAIPHALATGVSGQAQAAATYFYEDVYPGYQLSYSGVAPDGTFLLGSHNDGKGILYQLDTQGTLLRTYAVSAEYPEYPDCSLTLEGAAMIEDRIVMIAHSLRPSGSVIALGLPDGSVEFIRRLPGYCYDAIALEDGLLVCGCEWNDRDEEWAWVAKINGEGEVVWEYAGTPRDTTVPGVHRHAEFCSTFGDEYVVLRYDSPNQYTMIRFSKEGEVLFEQNLTFDYRYGGQLRGLYDLGDTLLLYGDLNDENFDRYAFIMAFDREGNTLWQNLFKQWGSLRDAICRGDALYLVAVKQIQEIGIFFSLIKMDLKGNLLKTWEWTLEDPRQWSDGNITAMLVDLDKNIWIAGRVTGVTLFLQRCTLE
jgi:hypothetical protein